MSTLTQAHDELFRRRPDECFSSVESLIQHCRNEQRESQDRWHLPARLQPTVVGGELLFAAGDDGEFLLNDWSFSQICRMSGVAKETVNRLSPDTAILDTISTIKRKDIATHGDYHTQRAIVEINDSLTESTRTGQQCQTRLDPPPPDPRVAHPPLHSSK